MKKILLLFLGIILLSGCQKNEEYELTFDMAMKCYVKVYEFKDGTTVYSIYDDIKYKTSDEEISIQEALDKKKIKLSDLESNSNFKIYKQNEEKCPSCCE